MTHAQPLPDADPRVVVLVSPACHLCDDACAIVAAVCAELSQTWVSRDLSELDEAAQAQWRELTPVVVVDGKVEDVFRTTADRLRAALR
jgi:hypothetical protein